MAFVIFMNTHMKGSVHTSYFVRAQTSDKAGCSLCPALSPCVHLDNDSVKRAGVLFSIFFFLALKPSNNGALTGIMRVRIQ